MTTRKKRPAAPPPVDAHSLAEFIGVDGDPDRLKKAIDLASAAAAAELGVGALPGNLSHPLAQAVKLLATRLLLLDKLEETPAGDDIPLVVRYYLKVAAGAQG
jgi:hypothetical protein